MRMSYFEILISLTNIIYIRSKFSPSFLNLINDFSTRLQNSLNSLLSFVSFLQLKVGSVNRGTGVALKEADSASKQQKVEEDRLVAIESSKSSVSSTIIPNCVDELSQNVPHKNSKICDESNVSCELKDNGIEKSCDNAQTVGELISNLVKNEAQVLLSCPEKENNLTSEILKQFQTKNLSPKKFSEDSEFNFEREVCQEEDNSKKETVKTSVEEFKIAGLKSESDCQEKTVETTEKSLIPKKERTRSKELLKETDNNSLNESLDLGVDSEKEVLSVAGHGDSERMKEGIVETGKNDVDAEMNTKINNVQVTNQLVTPENGVKSGNNSSENSFIADSLEEIYKEALKIKKQLLMSSSSSEFSEEDEEDDEKIVNGYDDDKEDDTNSIGGRSSDDSSIEEIEEIPREKITPPNKPKIESMNSTGKRNKQEEPDSDEELKRLMNLETLKRKRKMSDEGTSERQSSDDTNIKKIVKPIRKGKKPEVVPTLLDYYNQNDNESEPELESHQDIEESAVDDPMLKFIKENSKIVKQMILESSGYSETGESEEESSSEEKEENLKPNGDVDKKSSSNQRRPWMNDPLLRDRCSSLSSTEEEARWNKAKEKRIKSRKTLEFSSGSESFKPSSSSPESSTDSDFKPRAMKKTEEKDTDWTAQEISTDSEIEQVSTQKSADTPSKGRKNIKKILKQESLQVETKQALKLESERKKRLAEWRKKYNEFFPPSKSRRSLLVLDFDLETGEPLLKVHKNLAKRLKPHQAEGVKFMWENCFESLKRLEEYSGSGCILAHCMGLGKTFQVITLVHTILTNDTGVNTVMILCPLNTVGNWFDEFELWLRDVGKPKLRMHDITKFKRSSQRARCVKDWQSEGGVFILSYDMFRNLSKDNPKLRTKDLQTLRSALLDPGPHLVICDEGHLLKNEKTTLSGTVRKIKSLRRIVLTGTPLQNNLLEYHCMVQFIKPNILGSRKEFMNRFANPINNGQFEDSTEFDVKLMKRRSHVLHTILDGCIQRFDYKVLTPFLPEKHEYVIAISLTEAQAKAYQNFLTNFAGKGARTAEGFKSTRLFGDYQYLQKIWTHPFTIREYFELKLKNKQELREDGEDLSVIEFRRNGLEVLEMKSKEDDWWSEFFKEKDFENLEASYKFLLLFAILKGSKDIGDKVLVFSQSLYTLNTIEHFLNKANNASETNKLIRESGPWVLGQDYFRLDGQTNHENRSKWCRHFNALRNSRARLFLISTRAGGLGINLVAANRVIIFDASWNPSHDVQSIFRVYRFGQRKSCYIYRFLAEATMEEKIYNRQVTKLSLACRVVDEHQIERHFTMGSLQELYNFEPLPEAMWKTPNVPKDALFAKILTEHKNIIVGYHEHDSLLENKEEEELTEEERKAAWDDFEKEKERLTEGANNVVNVVEHFPNRLPMLENVASNSEILRLINQYRNTAFHNTSSSGGNYADLWAMRKAIDDSTSSISNNMLLSMGLARGLKPYEGEKLEHFRTRVFKSIP